MYFRSWHLIAEAVILTEKRADSMDTILFSRQSGYSWYCYGMFGCKMSWKIRNLFANQDFLRQEHLPLSPLRISHGNTVIWRKVQICHSTILMPIQRDRILIQWFYTLVQWGRTPIIDIAPRLNDLAPRINHIGPRFNNNTTIDIIHIQDTTNNEYTIQLQTLKPWLITIACAVR